MTRLTLPGIHYPPSPRRVVDWRPIIPTAIYGTKGMAFAPGFLDSGADLAHLPRYMAAHLGIDLAACEPVKTELGGQKQTSLRSDVPIRFGLLGYLVEIPYAFFGDPASHLGNAVLLGREVFEKFVVTIDHRAGRVHLDPYPDTPREADALRDYRVLVRQFLHDPNQPWEIDDLRALLEQIDELEEPTSAPRDVID